MGLLAWLGLRTETNAEFDPLTDAHVNSDFALSSFTRAVGDLSYANSQYQQVKEDAAERIRHFEGRMKQAHTNQQKNTNVITKINDLLGENDAGNTDSESHS